MYRALLILFAAGCAVEKPPAPDAATATAPAPTFTTDTYYTGIVPPYATPEDCEASSPNPIGCHLELAFCAGGVAGFSHFDLPERGDYYLDGSTVVATLASNESGGSDVVIELDTQTGHATGAEVDTYILDTAGRWGTLQFDPGVVCPDDAM